MRTQGLAFRQLQQRRRSAPHRGQIDCTGPRRTRPAQVHQCVGEWSLSGVLFWPTSAARAAAVQRGVACAARRTSSWRGCDRANAEDRVTSVGAHSRCASDSHGLALSQRPDAPLTHGRRCSGAAVVALSRIPESVTDRGPPCPVQPAHGGGGLRLAALEAPHRLRAAPVRARATSHTTTARVRRPRPSVASPRAHARASTSVPQSSPGRGVGPRRVDRRLGCRQLRPLGLGHLLQDVTCAVARLGSTAHAQAASLAPGPARQYPSAACRVGLRSGRTRPARSRAELLRAVLERQLAERLEEATLPPRCVNDLLAHGEAVVRVAPKLTVRERGAAANAASPTPSTPSRSPARRYAQGLDTLPVAQLAGPASTFACSSVTANA